MTRKYFRFIPSLLAILLIVSSCKKEEKEEYTYALPQSVLISAFSLVKNSNASIDLSQVFFSLDVNHRMVFNADSLPKGTKVDSLQISVTIPDGATATIKYQRFNIEKQEFEVKEVSYSDNKNEYIDFSNHETRPVTMMVTAADGTTKANYSLNVRVHKLNPEQMLWYTNSSSDFSTKRAFIIDGALQLYGEANVMPGARLTSMQVLGGAVFAVNGNNTGICKGTTLLAPVYDYVELIGVFGGQLVGVVRQGGEYRHFTSADGETLIVGEIIDTTFPVKGYSNTIEFNNGGFTQIGFFGGVDQQGKLTKGTWLYDGEQWANMSVSGYNPITPREGAQLANYMTDYGQITPRWLVIGGKNETGELSDVYMTTEYGIRWEVADTTLNVPASMGARSYASVVVGTKDLYDSYWQQVALPLRSQLRVGGIYPDAPYIYFFGGSIAPAWRCVLTQLNFYPID